MAILSDLFQEFLPVKLKQLVNVPKTYQNMFSISSGVSSKLLSVCLSEKAMGNIANRYMNVNVSHTVQWKGPMIARYLKRVLILSSRGFYVVSQVKCFRPLRLVSKLKSWLLG